jgi:hypothetical protein
VIHSLAKKPNAFRNSLLRDDLIPAGDFSLLWRELTQGGLSDNDCRYMVDLLVLADNYDCEQALGRHVLTALEGGTTLSIKQCRDFFGPDKIELPILISQQHSLDSYNCLMGGLNV